MKAVITHLTTPTEAAQIIVANAEIVTIKRDYHHIPCGFCRKTFKQGDEAFHRIRANSYQWTHVKCVKKRLPKLKALVSEALKQEPVVEAPKEPEVQTNFAPPPTVREDLKAITSTLSQQLDAIDTLAKAIETLRVIVQGQANKIHDIQRQVVTMGTKVDLVYEAATTTSPIIDEVASIVRKLM